MYGPRVLHFEDETAWRAFCKAKNAWPWYAKILPAFRPGMFTNTDGDGEPDEQDIIWVAPREWADLGKGKSYAVDLLHHEWLHNLVPYHSVVVEGLMPQSEYDSLVEKCSHPSKALEAIKHAHRTGYRTNAFTRLLRFNKSYVRRADFERWFQQVPEAAEAYHGA